MARWEERAATPEDKFFRGASRLDVAGGEGVAECPAWVQVTFTTCKVKKVMEAQRPLTMAISWARRGAMAS